MPSPQAPPFFGGQNHFQQVANAAGQTGAAVAGKQAGTNLQSMGPKTSLVDECTKHSGHMVLFEDWQGKKVCEICYTDKSKKKDTEKEEKAAQDDLFKRLQAPAPEKPEEEEEVKTQQQIVMDLHKQIEAQCQQLSDKISKKQESLILRHEHFVIYENTLNQKYDPVFQKMQDIIKEKRIEYQTSLLKQLNGNMERIKTEKQACTKLKESLQVIGSNFNQQLSSELEIIKVKDAVSEKLAKEMINKEEPAQPVEADEEKENEIADSKVNSYKIGAMATMLDDFENILAKNFCQFANKQDLTYMQKRTQDKVENEFNKFYDIHFTGDFQVKNWFNANVLPRLYFPQQMSKFIHCFKILHNIQQCILIQNTFPVSERSRSLVTPSGQMFLVGGYITPLKCYIKNTFTLDEHRSILVSLRHMNEARAEHAMLYSKGVIYVFGGEALVEGSEAMEVKSLNTCEAYDVAEDKWTVIPSFSKARQHFSCCSFNEKFIFIFGGKKVEQGYANGPKPFTLVQQVEVFEIEKKSWKTINYIGENQRLKVLGAGATQISSSQIMLFGGFVPNEDESNLFASKTEDDSKTSFDVIDNGVDLTLTNKSMVLDVTVGSIKTGPELCTPSYFPSGGYKMSHQGQIFAFGLTIPQIGAGLSSLSATAEPVAADPSKKQANYGNVSHKKTLHLFRPGETKWIEASEQVFSAGGARRDSSDNFFYED